MIRKRNSVQLWQELVFTLSLKAALLAALWAVFFSAPHDQADAVQHVAAHLFSPTVLKEGNHDADSGAR